MVQGGLHALIPISIYFIMALMPSIHHALFLNATCPMIRYKMRAFCL